MVWVGLEQMLSLSRSLSPSLPVTSSTITLSTKAPVSPSLIITSSLATATRLEVKMLKFREVEKLSEGPLRSIWGWWSLIGDMLMVMEQVWVSERLVREMESCREEIEGSSASEK